MITGIYKITNRINGHYYIGQSVGVKKRFREHCFAAAHSDNKDHNSPIHRALAKYGKDNFIFEIIEECSKEKLDKREIFWINTLKATSNGNYNILIGGQDRMKFDDKPVELYTLQGIYVKTVSSATKVAEELGVSRNSIYGVLHKERPICKGYQMKYEEDTVTVMKPFISRQGGSISVAQLGPNNGNIIQIFTSAAEAARKIGADSSTIAKVCKGKLKTAKGFAWKYYQENTEVET